jgi:hypothetical protein
MIRKAWHSNMRSWSECRGAILTRVALLKDPGRRDSRNPGRWQGLDCAERMRPGSIESRRAIIRRRPDQKAEVSQALNFRHHRTVWKMAFVPMRLKPESGANRIKSADDAYSFMMHMRLSDRNKPHWQMARQALNHAGASDDSEVRAWRSFRAAAAAEGWLLD